jgi:hypothetical protein
MAAPNSLEAARSLYATAYEAYRKACTRVGQKLASGEVPSAEEIEEEAKAVERLSAARRQLLDVMARLAPPRP